MTGEIGGEVEGSHGPHEPDGVGANPTPASVFIPFPKISRLSRNCIISEKLDGTNSQIWISDDLSEIKAGSRNRWIEPTKTGDNYGFARWVEENKDELIKLGPGRHFGEWWGLGIQRGYGMKEKVFSLFNTGRWIEGVPRPACVRVVPVLFDGVFSSTAVDEALDRLRTEGSVAAPGFMNPEGVIVYQIAARMYYKKTLDKDDAHKGD